jgi:hypothetical protein
MKLASHDILRLGARPDKDKLRTRWYNKEAATLAGLKRYIDREWKSANRSTLTKANTAIAATESKIESMGMIASSDAFYFYLESRSHRMTRTRVARCSVMSVSAMIRIKGSVALIELDPPRVPPFVRLGSILPIILRRRAGKADQIKVGAAPVCRLPRCTNHPCLKSGVLSSAARRCCPGCPWARR